MQHTLLFTFTQPSRFKQILMMFSWLRVAPHVNIGDIITNAVTTMEVHKISVYLHAKSHIVSVISTECQAGNLTSKYMDGGLCSPPNLSRSASKCSCVNLIICLMFHIYRGGGRGKKTKKIKQCPDVTVNTITINPLYVCYCTTVNVSCFFFLHSLTICMWQ